MTRYPRTKAQKARETLSKKPALSPKHSRPYNLSIDSPPNNSDASTRPRRGRLGWLPWSWRRHRQYQYASMRPRRGRLGWNGTAQSGEAAVLISMRPRLGRLGWYFKDEGARFVNASFNEAEARAPRMAAGAARCAAPNDCASMRPRRGRLGWPAIQDACRALLAASMRPRRGRLGWTARRLPRVALSTSFNEAEARAPRMVRNCRGAARDQGASMRPRRGRLGWSRPVTRWSSRQSRRVFERSPVTACTPSQIPHAVVLTMSNILAIPTV